MSGACSPFLSLWESKVNVNHVCLTCHLLVCVCLCGGEGAFISILYSLWSVVFHMLNTWAFAAACTSVLCFLFLIAHLLGSITCFLSPEPLEHHYFNELIADTRQKERQVRLRFIEGLLIDPAVHRLHTVSLQPLDLLPVYYCTKVTFSAAHGSLYWLPGKHHERV